VGVMGRPSFRVEEKDRHKVQKLAGLGIRQDDIAESLNISAKTLRKHFRAQLSKGMIEANEQVMDILFKMATSGSNTTATIFWAKTRCGFRETGPPPAVEEDKAPRVVFERG